MQEYENQWTEWFGKLRLPPAILPRNATLNYVHSEKRASRENCNNISDVITKACMVLM